MSDKVTTLRCAYCSKPMPWAVEFTIHRDGFGEGPEVPLCRRCGEGETPTCDEIWDRISKTTRA